MHIYSRQKKIGRAIDEKGDEQGEQVRPIIENEKYYLLKFS